MKSFSDYFCWITCDYRIRLHIRIDYRSRVNNCPISYVNTRINNYILAYSYIITNPNQRIFFIEKSARLNFCICRIFKKTAAFAQAKIMITKYTFKYGSFPIWQRFSITLKFPIIALYIQVPSPRKLFKSPL